MAISHGDAVSMRLGLAIILTEHLLWQVSDALRVHPEFWGLLLRQVDHVDVSLY
jgi:hypothetical protein